MDISLSTFIEWETIMHLVHLRLEKDTDIALIFVVCGYEVPPHLFYHPLVLQNKELLSRNNGVLK